MKQDNINGIESSSRYVADHEVTTIEAILDIPVL